MDNKVDAVLELTQTGFKSRCRLKIGLDFDRDIKRVMLPLVAALNYRPASCIHLHTLS